jgi:ADP-heptose:LPS heptosyltransferase
LSALKRAGQTIPKQIVIFRALQLGDMLNAVPAFRALRRAFPDARVTLVGLPWSTAFVERFHEYLDDFIVFPGFPGLPEQQPNVKQFPSFLRWMQAMEIDLAIQMQGSGQISNPMVSLWGAKQTAGFYLPGNYCPDARYFLEYPGHEPEIWRHLRLMESLGIPPQGDEVEFPLFEKDWEEFHHLRDDYGLQREFICIHPGARKEERRWPVHCFAEVADGLAARGFQVVLTGSSEEKHLTAAVVKQMKMPAIDLAGGTSLGGLAALISKARLVVNNDTGISHVTAAVKTPSVILFSADDMDRWAPKNRRLHKVIWPAANTAPASVLAQAELHLRNIYHHVLSPEL